MFHLPCFLFINHVAASKSNIANRCFLFVNFCQLSKFKINWIVFAGAFTSALNKPCNLRKIWILSINQSNAKINKRTKYWPIRLLLLSLLSNSSLSLPGFYYVLIMTATLDFSLHPFDDSDFQKESSATDLLKMWKNNQNKNTQRSRKTWIKAYDLYSMPLQKLDLAYSLGQFSEFFSSNYFQIGQHVTVHNFVRSWTNWWFLIIFEIMIPQLLTKYRLSPRGARS